MARQNKYGETKAEYGFRQQKLSKFDLIFWEQQHLLNEIRVLSNEKWIKSSSRVVPIL